MAKLKQAPTVALLWTQFGPYHVDRCEAVARALEGRAEIVGCEIASASTTYAWTPSGDIGMARKVVLFPGLTYQNVGRWRRLKAMFAVLSKIDVTFVGVSYAEPEIVALTWLLRMAGKRVYMMSDSKFDDKPRRLESEFLKPFIFAPYHGAIVAGNRHEAYVRFLGYRKRPVVQGYDCVDLNRVRRLGVYPPAPGGPAFSERPFVVVARFVAKKNLLTLLDAYERYIALAGPKARRLVLVGGGDLEAQIVGRITGSVLTGYVERKGFLQADGVAAALSGALALVLPSIEEQWGLVVNEALAFSLPIIVSENVGARDALVSNLVNGYVVGASDADSLAQALFAMGEDEARWLRMVKESGRRAPLADINRFVDAISTMLWRSAGVLR
jgi:glycosyltransferase involved in cell wall biosynthesis